MRNLSAKALNKIAEQYGSEPVNVLEISWSDDAPIQMYADISNNHIQGKILEISSLDNIINVTDSADSQEISVTLDDTDGAIKTIMNSNDIHKRDVWVKQWFKGLSFDDRFLLFRGKISSPIEWKEGDRTVSFTIISQLEDKEVGFSPEEGQFPYIPKELIGQTWPLIFGTPLDVPAVQINKAITGTILCGVGIISGQQYHRSIPIGGLPPDTRLAEAQSRHVNYVSSAWFGESTELYKQYSGQHSKLREQIDKSWSQYERKRICAIRKRGNTLSDAEEDGEGCNPVRILGGEDFPRGEIQLNIGGGVFTGYFNDDLFYITSRRHKEDEDRAEAAANPNHTPCDTSAATPAAPQWYHFEDRVPPDSSFSLSKPGWYETTGVLFPGIPSSTENQPKQTLQQFWADAGTKVDNDGFIPLYYIVSIIPGTVLKVKAYKDFHGDKRLVDVPTSLYNVINVTYGTIDTVQIVLTKALTSITDQEWAGDDIYVTFESSVGPNIVDILMYLIDNYSDLTIDATSFASVKTKLEPFPANFAILDRKNIVEVLQEIAFQARCSLRISNGVFYLSYLPEEPTAVDTLTEDDIENQSVSITLTDTEDLVTKYIVKWRLSYAQEDLDRIVLRHNVNKYGIQEETYEYYIYNQPDIIFKIATFWLIRKSNSWKKFSCNVFLNKLNLETFDAVTLDFNTNYVSNSSVKAIIEKATFDSENQIIELECWVPIKAGSMVEYPFAWPADEEEDAAFPTQEEFDAGNAGGNGIGADAIGNLPIGQIPLGDNAPIYIGGPNIVFGPQTDTGDPYPTDVGFTAQSLRIDSTIGDVDPTLKPVISLSMFYLSDSQKLELPDRPKSVSLILEKTKIFTTEGEEVGYLDDILKFNSDGDDTELCLKLDAPVVDITDTSKFGKLNDVWAIADDEGDDVLANKTTAKYTDETDTGEFDYKFDTEGEKWGAGTAFLKEED